MKSTTTQPESPRELLPCPWCGSVPEAPYTNNVGETYARLRHEEGCCLGLGETFRREHWIPGAAFEAWNTRANQAELEQLKEALMAIKPVLAEQQIAGCSGSDIFTLHIKARDIKALLAALAEGKP